MTCIICGTTSTQPLCSNCHTNLTKAITALANNFYDLEAVALKGVRLETGVHIQRSTVPLPIRWDAFKLLGEIDDLTRHVCRHIQLHPSRRFTTRDLLRGILVNMEKLMRSPQLVIIAKLFLTQAEKMRMIFNTKDEDMVKLGVCQRCGGELWGLPSASFIRCPACAAVADVNELHLLRLRDLATADVPLDEDHKWSPSASYTASSISSFLQSAGLRVSRKLINQWEHRGFLRQQGKTDDGRALYTLGDVLTLGLSMGERHASMKHLTR